MPTASKLIGAIIFAALAWYVSDLVKPLLPEGTRVGWMSPLNALIGCIMGWNIMGKGTGVSYRQAMGFGLTTAAATVFWALLLWGGYEMYRRSVRLYYDGPVEGLQDMALIMIKYAQLAAVQDTIIPLVIGAIFGSWITEFFGRRWS